MATEEMIQRVSKVWLSDLINADGSWNHGTTMKSLIESAIDTVMEDVAEERRRAAILEDFWGDMNMRLGLQEVVKQSMYETSRRLYA